MNYLRFQNFFYPQWLKDQNKFIHVNTSQNNKNNMKSVDNHSIIQVEDIVEHDVDNNQDNTDTCNLNIVKDHNKIQVDDIIVENIDNTCNRNQVQDISHYTTSSNTCNYRLTATNTNKRNETSMEIKSRGMLS